MYTRFFPCVLLYNYTRHVETYNLVEKCVKLYTLVGKVLGRGAFLGSVLSFFMYTC